MIDSHHDILLSSVQIPSAPISTISDQHLLSTAPRIPNTRHKIIWSEEGVASYQAEVSWQLTRLRSQWSMANSKASASILLHLTNEVLASAAAKTNKSISLSSSIKTKAVKIQSEIKKAARLLKVLHRDLKNAVNINTLDTKENLKKARKDYRYLLRRHNHSESLRRDSQLFSIMSNSTAIYRSIRSLKSSSARSVPFLTVGNKRYEGSRVADGMFDSISALKMQNEESLSASTYFETWSEDYQYILELCKNKRDIPTISLKQSSEILLKMKPSVKDYWSITPQHFINAGDTGFSHFNYLMNKIICETNISTVKELNTTYALLLHKGHGKSRTSDRSYRTISTCPVLAKGLDMYIHHLFAKTWNSVQADTQYQGEGSNHELSALLITESIQQSLHSLHSPVYLLFLDARSAFDTVVISFLIRNLYLTGMTGNSIHYLNNRLCNRLTYCDWEKELMGPIHDQHGLEQGGCNSSDLYKIYNNELLKTVQHSGQGVDMGGGLVVSGVGQADDVALLSNDLYKLFNILHLTLNFCKKFSIELCADKTKLLMISRSTDKIFIPFNPININGQNIDFSDQAEHVGVIRSCDGNMPNLVNRFAAHRKALAANLPCGIARSHRANLAACVKVEKLYALPVLMSGLASLVLSNSEVNHLDQHYLTTLRNLLKLHTGTPHSFIYFMAGSLPGRAFLHLRQIGLFIMISHLPSNPLFLRAKHVLSCHQSSSKSWFSQIRKIFLQYRLPHPLSILENPPSKSSLKKLARSLVIDYWENKLRQDLSLLPSLVYFRAEFCSLNFPHPITWTAASNPHEVTKAVVQAKMLSGRYRTAKLTSHWSQRCSDCQAPDCKGVVETLEHMLVACPFYAETLAWQS